MESLTLLTGEEVAEILKVSPSKAYSLMRTEIPVVKMGRSVRVRAEDLEQYIRSKTVVPEGSFVLKYPKNRLEE